MTGPRPSSGFGVRRRLTVRSSPDLRSSPELEASELPATSLPGPSPPAGDLCSSCATAPTPTARANQTHELCSLPQQVATCCIFLASCWLPNRP
ncbi:F-box/kelch-repeat protein [Iris pallida]|uniref:F-box/kelch-repeat protein n=1 Tax=Iris pallida TaxID=29817 RepID=A0AAX6FDY9_IRIPA|nr:F-box/kelch-repeat protein [Iris pallida]